MIKKNSNILIHTNPKISLNIFLIKFVISKFIITYKALKIIIHNIKEIKIKIYYYYLFIFYKLNVTLNKLKFIIIF